jgi:cell division transport system permease protein
MAAVNVGYVVRETASNLWRNRLMSAAAMLTVAVSLSLVGGAFLLRQGVDKAAGVWQGGVQMIIFMRPSATAGEIGAIRANLEADPSVSKFRYVDKAQAYQEFKAENAGSADGQAVISVTPESAMPPSFRVYVRNAALVRSVGAAYAHQEGVWEVAYDAAAVQTLMQVSSVVQNVLLGISVVLLLSAVMLILNAIRMAIFGRRREVAVMKLVGATNWFIRVPFMLEGLVQGLVGAIVAAGALEAARVVVQSVINHAQLSLLRPLVLSAAQAVPIQVAVIAIGALVGVIGSAAAVRRFLEV